MQLGQRHRTPRGAAKDECRATVEKLFAGVEEELGNKPAPVTLRLPRISCEVIWD